ncbi:TIM barrel protein [Thermoactinospora rubra]|uniref:TIM barrel protein n=1 Tax=Thermoactinospora rubra TaxID=1088767 RepID=UPI000A11C68D|nr:TIM barrel protein [Thermoactinospora rubra]
MRIAGAPISWGVCEVPGWGHQLPPGRVLAEMRKLGITATELGPEGYLSPSVLTEYGLRGIGAFLPVVLHDPAHDPLPDLERTAREFAEAGIEVMVLAAATGADGYDTRPTLDETGWATLLRNLDRAMELDRTVTLHPHVGTMVETREEVMRVLEGGSALLCLDTGHLLIGGTDPLELATAAPERVAHVHLKDVDAGLAARVPEIGYTRAVREGVYRPLGEGDVDVAGIVSALGKHGYAGWYVMEQDVVLSGPEDEPVENVRRSLAYLEGLRRG